MRLNIKFLQAGFCTSIKLFCLLLDAFYTTVKCRTFEVPGIEFSLNVISSNRRKVAIQHVEQPYLIKHRDVSFA